jgi:arginine decarboxylase-like protein
MKPDPKRFLEVAAAHVMMNVAPALSNGYEQSGAMVLAAMLMAVNEEMERAAARRVEENRELRRIFAGALAVVTDAGLRGRLASAASGDDTSFTVSDLERSNAELRALLIELHAHVEESNTPDARRVEAAIWRELVASTERRRLMMAPF